MIKFFRKIKQNLLGENKFRKYLLYAIGEIVLVVIGILIALQINNWNENRKEKLTEAKYLLSIKTDLMEQSNILQDLIIFHEKQYISNASKATNLIENNQHLENLDSLRLWLNRCANTRTFSVIDATYEGLKTTGHFQNISNSEVKKSIVTVYKLLVEQEKMFAKNNNVIEQNFSSYILRNEPGFYLDMKGQLRSEKLKDPEVIYTLLRLLKSREGHPRNSIQMLSEITVKIDNLVAQISK